MQTTLSWYRPFLINPKTNFSKTFHRDLHRMGNLSSEVGKVNASALTLIESLDARFPSQLVLVKTIKVAQFLARTQRERIREHTRRGDIRISTYEQVLNKLEHILKKLKETPFAYVKSVGRMDHGGERRAERASPDVKELEGVGDGKDGVSLEQRILEFDRALYCEHAERLLNMHF
jgi:hypothetical protein